jgi:hypothetical protein
VLLVQIGWCGNPNLTKTHDGHCPVAFGDVGLTVKSSESSDQKISSYTTSGDASNDYVVRVAHQYDVAPGTAMAPSLRP